MILVTGATGLVGSHLLVQLLQENEEVKALFRSEKQIEKVKNVFAFHNQTALFNKINWVKGDITDIPSLEIAFENVTHVYHCAALISFDPSDEDELRKINIEGTANVVNCCIDFDVKKLCHVSSIAALGNPKEHETTITEETEWNPEELHSDYAITKYGAEMEVLRGHQEGLEVVIVNPGVIFGYGFPKKGSDVIIQSVKKGLSFYTKGNIGIVSVADVTNCMTQLMKSSINGERYTLVGENISTKALLDFIAEELKLKKPSIEATKLMTSIAWRIDWLISKILNRKRKLSRNTAISSHSVTTFDTSKIEKELNFTFQKKETYLKTILQNYYTRQH
ncbi:NAD-dependent epimerase/dehydratase family protein [Flavobacterium cheniae]|uniref:Nucleoside-diphosphate-sugar epimerase n=1 Tax=Flavobacterium cheniae TaxID=295428 RepID=A0A562KM03_9FLAO|nr:NAD-dependent epimerase/dehydratase family protein [Flavobacterium cheniae]TDR24297.1 nucleoside-diphosphate-sugar epimerase [Flavobacterium cheniae]TWH96416.1 nucleoside-diphosphate-sugar epimerase [Flavobacterium cheniae]